MGTTERRWAEFVVETDAATVPQPAIDAAGRSVFDGIGCILAATEDPATRPLLELARAEGEGGGATVLGTDIITAPTAAALANGTLAHWLDFDDGRGACGHPASVLLPTALAVGERDAVSGQDLLVAYAIGLEAATHLSDASDYDEKQAGFHRTPLFGSIGATALAARLAGLDVEQAVMALAIVGSMGSGVCQNFGTRAKPMHAGLAARNAVTAVHLAGQGWTGSEDILAGPVGWASSYLGHYDYLAMSRDLGADWRTPDDPPMWKAYPCCGASHGPLASFLGLRDEHGFSLEDVAEVEVHTTYDSMVMMVEEPTSGYQGKFSLRYTIATALLDGRIDIDSFTDQKLLRPEYAAASAKVRISLTSKWDLSVSGHGTDKKRVKPSDGMPVTVRLHDGTVMTRSTPRIRGLETEAEVAAKFRGNAARALPTDQVERAVATWARPHDITDVRTAVAELVAPA